MVKAYNEYLESIHNYWIDIKNREIWIHGIDTSGPGYEGDEPGVEYVMANRVIKNLHILMKEDRDKPAIVHLHSCGGFYEEGMAIYDTIKAMPFHVTIISYTHARSMSSIIFQAGDKRIMLPNSYFMFHWGTIAADGHAISVRSEIDFSKIQDKNMIDIYVKSARDGKKFKDKTDKYIRNAIETTMNNRGDVFLTPEETIEWGFADEIFTEWPSI